LEDVHPLQVKQDYELVCGSIKGLELGHPPGSVCLLQRDLVSGKVGVGSWVVSDVETVVDQLYVLFHMKSHRLVLRNLVVNYQYEDQGGDRGHKVPTRASVPPDLKLEAVASDVVQISISIEP
jgi:hypothetical protein